MNHINVRQAGGFGLVGAIAAVRDEGSVLRIGTSHCSRSMATAVEYSMASTRPLD